MLDISTSNITPTTFIRQCESLAEVRTQIDGIDQKIVHLISQRSRYVSQAGKFKSTTTEMVASDRVQAVINKIRVLSDKEGLNPDIAEKVYRTMIRVFTEKEIEESDSIYKTIKESYY